MGLRKVTAITAGAVTLSFSLAVPAAAETTGNTSQRSAPACLDLSGNGPGANAVENRCNYGVRFKTIDRGGRVGPCQFIAANDVKYVQNDVIRITRAGC